MIALEKAIISSVKSDATLSALAGPYADDAPENRTIPYIVFSHMPLAGKTEYFDGDVQEAWEIQFNTFADSRMDARTYQQALRAVFRRQFLSLSSGENISTLVVRESCRKAGRDPSGEPVYQSTSVLRFRVVRSD
jgi:hypothetical protein